MPSGVEQGCMAVGFRGLGGPITASMPSGVEQGIYRREESDSIDRSPPRCPRALSSGGVAPRALSRTDTDTPMAAANMPITASMPSGVEQNADAVRPITVCDPDHRLDAS